MRYQQRWTMFYIKYSAKVNKTTNSRNWHIFAFFPQTKLSMFPLRQHTYSGTLLSNFGVLSEEDCSDGQKNDDRILSCCLRWHFLSIILSQYDCLATTCISKYTQNTNMNLRNPQLEQQPCSEHQSGDQDCLQGHCPHHGRQVDQN